MTIQEEHQLARGVNALHDEGSVHATDLEKLIKFLEIAAREDLRLLSGQNFLKGVALIMV